MLMEIPYRGFLFRCYSGPYSRLGFDAREPVSVMQGPPLRRQIQGCSVRPARASDVENCNRLCMQVHGHDRAGELADALKGGTAVVVERHGRITGYATVLAFSGTPSLKLTWTCRH
jgi:hypothetical protein